MQNRAKSRTTAPKYLDPDTARFKIVQSPTTVFSIKNNCCKKLQPLPQPWKTIGSPNTAIKHQAKPMYTVYDLQPGCTTPKDTRTERLYHWNLRLNHANLDTIRSTLKDHGHPTQGNSAAIQSHARRVIWDNFLEPLTAAQLIMFQLIIHCAPTYSVQYTPLVQTVSDTLSQSRTWQHDTHSWCHPTNVAMHWNPSK